ncbi:MAG: T9SS type A sorting domain-containing protein, partial [Bacteroidales bacterium]
HVVDIQWGSGTTGIVSVYAESGQGCYSDTSSSNVSVRSTGMGEFEAHGFSIYPVPAHDFLVIETDDLKPYSISLSSVNGAVLVQASFEGSSQVDLSMFPTGFYILTIQTGEFTASKKIILGSE